MSILGVLTGTRGEVNTYGVFHKALRIAGIQQHHLGHAIGHLGDRGGHVLGLSGGLRSQGA